MKKEINIFKISNYDKFKCIADKCKFTCCEGWDINIDNNTYDKWSKVNDDSDYLLNNVKSKKCGNKKIYFINKEIHEACPFLDNKGLCYVVKNHGENYLSSTCHMFPRIENIFDDRREFLLSCACPEVVNIINNMDGKIGSYSEDNKGKNNLLELNIREILINIMQQNNLSIEYKLIITFGMLLSILDSETFNNDVRIIEEIERFKDRDYIEEIVWTYKDIIINLDESIEEINYLFLDIIQDYKEVPMFNSLLRDISDFTEEVEFEILSSKWREFKKLFEEQDNLIENCIVSKILSNCVDRDIEDITIAFQMIILDYLLVRYAVFLKYCMSDEGKIYVEDVKDYIVAFSRIIGNNTEAVKEFLIDGFGDAILEIGYLCFITLF